MHGDDLIPLPKTHVGTRLEWALDVIRSSRTPSDAEVVSQVAPWVLEMVSPNQFVASLHDLHEKLGKFTIRGVEPDNDLSVTVALSAANGEPWEARCSVDHEGPNLIEQLAFSPAEPDDGAPGYVVFLNGTSSSGKSSIAHQLQGLLADRLWLHVQLDAFMEMLPREQRHGLQRFFTGTHQAIAQLALAGNSLIIDHVLESPDWFDQLVSALDRIPVLYVGVKAPLDVLEQRERDRGDRRIGLARFQLNLVHRHSPYDLELDTSALTPAECAEAIRDRIAGGPGTAITNAAAVTPEDQLDRTD